jgi:hypothetical protein
LLSPQLVRRQNHFTFRSRVGRAPSGPPDKLGLPRKHIEDKLDDLPGKQLIVVRCSPDHSSLDEWVYNSPNIDNSKIVGAREMDAENNLELIHYYKDRTVWLVQPDNKQQF